MSQKLPILILPGMGEHDPNFDHDLRENLLQEFNDALQQDAVFQSALYHETFQGNQNAVWERMQQTDIGQLNLRKFFLYYFSDAATIGHDPTAPNSVYKRIQHKILQALSSLEGQVGQTSMPLVIVAYSLGCHVISNYIWDAAHGKGIFKDEVPNPTAFQKMETCQLMITCGCNIPLFVSGNKNIVPINKPTPEFEWFNYYDKQDILGWPLKPLSTAYNQIITQDIEANTGSALNSHVNYFKSKEFIKPAAFQINNLYNHLD